MFVVVVFDVLVQPLELFALDGFDGPPCVYDLLSELDYHSVVVVGVQ